MNTVNQLVRSLIDSRRQATDEEQQRIIAHVAQAPLSSRPMKITQWLRQELEAQGVHVASEKLPSVELHLLKRIYVDGQWPPGTTVAQFTADLHRAVQHPDVRIWTYRWLGEAFVGFLAPSHVQDAPNPETFLFITYSADYGTIKTGFQASRPETIFTGAVDELIRHR